jgi:hypothetical protein
MKRLFGVLLLGVFTLATGCGSASTDSSATAPTATVSTDTFTGTVDVGGQDAHQFTVVTSGGQVNVDLTAAGPPSTIYMGLGVGVFSSPTCTLLTNGSVVTQAGATAQLTGTVNAGTYCVMVYDAGNQSAQVSYSVVVNHY